MDARSVAGGGFGRVDPRERGVEPQEYLKILRRWWWVVALAVLLATAIGFVTAPTGSERVVSSGTRYQATMTFIVDPSREVVPLDIERAAFFTTTGVVPDRAAEITGYGGPGAQLAAEITATGDPALGTLQITTTQAEPDDAVQIARAFGDSLVEFLDDQGRQLYEREVRAEVERTETLESDLSEVESLIVTGVPEDELSTEQLVLRQRRETIIREIGIVEQRLSELTEQGPENSGLLVLEEPTPIAVSSGGGFSPPASRTSRVPLFGMFGLVLGVVLALVVSRFDTRLRGRDEIVGAYDLPVIDQIGVIPKSLRSDTQLLSFEHPDSPMAEEFRALRATLAFAIARPATGRGAVIAVTSATPGEGKSTTVANLAVAFAEHGDRVIVINGDFRRSTANRLLSVRVGAGLSDVLAHLEDRPPRRLREVLRSGPVPGVQVVGQGDVAQRPASLLKGFPEVLDQARALADVVLVDTAPILAAYEVAEMIPSVDLVAVLCRVGKVRTGAATRAGEVVRRAQPNQAGIVLIGAGTTISSYGAYGEYGDYGDRDERGVADQSANGRKSARSGEPAAR